jgi:hypothetical protein
MSSGVTKPEWEKMIGFCIVCKFRRDPKAGEFTPTPATSATALLLLSVTPLTSPRTTKVMSGQYFGIELPTAALTKRLKAFGEVLT